MIQINMLDLGNKFAVTTRIWQLQKLQMFCNSEKQLAIEDSLEQINLNLYI